MRPIARGQSQLKAVILIDQEECQMLNGERPQETFRGRRKHLVKIRLGAKFAREFDQRAPVVVALFVEEILIQVLLDPLANRLKDEGGDDDEDSEA